MKDQKDLLGLSRNAFVNQLHTLAERKPRYNMHGLVKENLLSWFTRNLVNIFTGFYKYQSYLRPEINNGIFRIKQERTSIALLADWASNTKESHNIGKLVGDVDYSIHLGDTYYAGNYKEITENFNDTIGAKWPWGLLGSFALLGNHEMYSSGKSYFEQLLTYMGVVQDGQFQKQEASYFCLENDYWRIIGLDTGYNSIMGPFGADIVRFFDNIDLELPSKHLDWLRDIVRPSKDVRGIILLSHHQFISAFDKNEYRKFVDKFSPLFNPDQTVLWFWGHEHRLAVYGRNKLPNGANFFARCIGHGGMPVEVRNAEVLRKDRGLVLFDERTRNTIKKNFLALRFKDIPLGHNGFARLNLNKSELEVQYFSDRKNEDKELTPQLILTERWKIDNTTGKLAGHDITLNPDGATELTLVTDKRQAIE